MIHANFHYDGKANKYLPREPSWTYEPPIGAEEQKATFDKAPTSGLQSEQSKNDFRSNAFINRNPTLRNALHDIAVALDIQDDPALTIEALETSIVNLKAKEKVQAPRAQLVHRVLKKSENSETKKQMYLDAPLWLEGETSSREALAGDLPLRSISSYLSNHPEVCCIIYRDCDVTAIIDEDPQGDIHDTQGKQEHNAETIEPVNESLAIAISKFLDYHYFNIDDTITIKSVNLTAPYFAFYHVRGDGLKKFMGTLRGLELAHFQVLVNYIASQYENEYNLVDAMTREGKITQAYIRYLFKPGDIIVQGKNQDTRGYLCQSWLEEDLTLEMKIIPNNRQKIKGKKKKKKISSMKAWYWDFDGQFLREKSTLSVEFDANDYSETNIGDLGIRPLRCVDGPTETRLKTRGEWLWKCRERRMVSYDGTLQGFRHSGDERYMVDMMMYRELHKSDPSKTLSDRQLDVDYLEPEAMKQKHPPDDNFIYLAPLTTKAYNLKRKKWVDLKLDGLRDVSWNTRAFESLVIKEKTKRLIQALISNQIETEKSTDLISGKGNGLIMLLHGGPGTGKTLTAESVAEIAEKPLYPVTCGDIGTKPEDVEKYLESVLYLGKTWGCVVLLDEADVFLEQRSLEDLHRNALVSVFLRVLEYYDGILILTSNRVGTFDEAFKSRIQLAVHYSNLSTHQRTKIWGNFIRRLKELNEEGVDFLDLEDNIEHLASKEMNGREIRNVTTTARQYARWERQQAQDFKLNYKVMKEVIETAGEFDEYINTLNGGLTQEQLAKEDGIR